MYCDSVDSHFHAALWSCRECFTCSISTGPHNDARKKYVLPLAVPKALARSKMVAFRSLFCFRLFSFRKTHWPSHLAQGVLRAERV